MPRSHRQHKSPDIHLLDPPTTGINQQWYYTRHGNNHLQWTNQSKYLDLTNGNLTDGNQVWDTGYMFVSSLSPQTFSPFPRYNKLPNTFEFVDDFCLWAYLTMGDVERDVVAYCTKVGRGKRLMSDGTLLGV